MASTKENPASLTFKFFNDVNKDVDKGELVDKTFLEVQAHIDSVPYVTFLGNLRSHCIQDKKLAV